MRPEVLRRLLSVLSDERLADCDETVRIECAATLLDSGHPKRGAGSLSELTAVYERLRLGADRTAEELLCPLVEKLIELARAAQQFDEAEARLERALARQLAVYGAKGGE